MHDFKGEKGTLFLHNSFSGDVLVINPNHESNDPQEIEIPFEDMKEFVAESVRWKKINKLENAEVNELLGL